MVRLTPGKIKKIPLQSLGVLCMHMCGIDVKEKMHVNSYYRHKAILAAYGYDINKPAKHEK